jgi:hypothetical protein
MKTLTFRMNLRTYRKIRRLFYARKDETTAEYFERLSEYLEHLKIQELAKLTYQNKYTMGEI